MKSLYFSLFILLCTASYAQVPEFEFKMHFMDAVGNRDSIVLGYDPSATFDINNGEFGEQIINAPFDSIFEVRASFLDGITNFQPTSKRNITWYSCPDSLNIYWIYSAISVQINHPPLKVWWDKTLFSESIDCRDSSVIVDRDIWFQYPMAAAYPQLAYMASTDTFVHPMIGSDDFQPAYLHPVKGGGQDTIKMLFVGFTYKSLVDSDVANEASQASTLEVYPNPASTYIEVRTGLIGEGELSLWDMQGRCLTRVASEDLTHHRFDTRDLPRGAYSLQVLHQGAYHRKIFLVE